jgi:3',5'-cyclic AMP phosphodiesterase CpdA
LRATSLVDHRGYWIGKTTTLVQTGDIVDRGTDTIALYRLFDQLRTQAADAGGEVISLLGNHEVRNTPIGRMTLSDAIN